MNSPTKSISYFLLAIAVTSTGCTSSGWKPSFAAWKTPVDEKIIAEPGLVPDQTETDESIALVSAQAPSRETLTTLGKNENFNLVIQDAPGVVLVDFYADWCGPCRLQSKVLHEVEKQAASSGAQIVKVDIEQHESLAKKYDVKSLPTLVVLKDGEVVRSKTGLTSRNDILAMLK